MIEVQLPWAVAFLKAGSICGAGDFVYARPFGMAVVLDMSHAAAIPAGDTPHDHRADNLYKVCLEWGAIAFLNPENIEHVRDNLKQETAEHLLSLYKHHKKRMRREQAQLEDEEF